MNKYLFALWLVASSWAQGYRVGADGVLSVCVRPATTASFVVPVQVLEMCAPGQEPGTPDWVAAKILAPLPPRLDDMGDEGDRSFQVQEVDGVLVAALRPGWLEKIGDRTNEEVAQRHEIEAARLEALREKLEAWGRTTAAATAAAERDAELAKADALRAQ